jgi:DNA modification methylase
MGGSVLVGHTLQVLASLPDEFADCVVTSPPYYQTRVYTGAEAVWGGREDCEHIFELKEHLPEASRFRTSKENGMGPHLNTRIYGNQTTKSGFCKKCGAWFGQLGLEPSPSLYLKHLLLVTKEIKRVLKKTGTLFLNIADSYDSKRLLLIPERLAVKMVDEQGWILRNDLIWFKRNAMPESVKDRWSRKHEYVFFFVKSGKYFFEQKRKTDERVERVLSSISVFPLERYSTKYPDGSKPASLSSIAGKRRSVREVAPLLFPQEEAREVIRLHHDHGRGPVPGDVLEVNTRPSGVNHIAVFPEELVLPLIEAGSPPGGLVLDPFAGSGTTLVAAKLAGRNFVGIELVPAYAEEARRRLRDARPYHHHFKML